MLNVAQIRQSAALAGARDIGSIEIDVLLTHVLQLFREKGLTDHLAFKGGTYLRKMVFGPRGRLSTDLDFTRRTKISRDDLSFALRESMDKPYRGISFSFPRDKDWYETPEGCAANPILSHAGNAAGVKVKIQVSLREEPIRPVEETPQVEQSYFKHLNFAPAAIPSLAVEEVIAEKIRAASQRSKIRDLHDLSEISRQSLARETIRSLAVLKLWQSGGDGLDFDRFRKNIERGESYDPSELKNLLRRDQTPDLRVMIARVVYHFKFLAQMTETERLLASDSRQKLRAHADALIAMLRPRAFSPRDSIERPGIRTTDYPRIRIDPPSEGPRMSL